MKQPMGGSHKAYKMTGKVGMAKSGKMMKAKSGKMMKAKTGKLTESQKKLPKKLQKIIKA